MQGNGGMGVHFVEVMEDVEFSTSRPLNIEKEDEMPSISGLRINSKMIHLLALKVNPLHVIFDLNGILVETRLGGFQSTRTIAHTQMHTFGFLVLKPSLKEFIIRCLIEFTM
jgi:hypothetical protein